MDGQLTRARTSTSSYQKEPEPTLEEATDALRAAYTKVRDVWGFAEDCGGNAEVRAFRAGLVTEAAEALTGATYVYGRAAREAAKPKK